MKIYIVASVYQIVCLLHSASLLSGTATAFVCVPLIKRTHARAQAAYHGSASRANQLDECHDYNRTRAIAYEAIHGVP